MTDQVQPLPYRVAYSCQDNRVYAGQVDDEGNFLDGYCDVTDDVVKAMIGLLPPGECIRVRIMGETLYYYCEVEGRDDEDSASDQTLPVGTH